jgi:uncharacterized repeat protein (TIGR01451 family)
LVVGQLRPGFSGLAYVTLKNIGTTVKSGSMNVTLNHPDITITASTPSATSITGNNASLSYNLNPAEQIIYTIEYDVAVAAVLGSAVVGSASAPDVTDLTPLNNYDTVHRIIMGSYDPNSKNVFPENSITTQFVSNGDPLEYIIHFQNTGNDTAFTVILIDTISSKLNMNSFQLISSSHPVITDNYGNEIWFRFYNIDLVDSTTNEPKSNGFVKYSIVPKSTCVLGDVIENKAYIYFDFNTPIVTNTTSTIVSNNMSVDEINHDNYTYVFPNPSNIGFFTVKSNEGIHAVEIFDAIGQKIKSVNVNNVPETKVSTNNLKAGIYFVKIYCGDKIRTEKIVIQ